MPDGTLMGRAHAFERGEKLYITTPLTLVRPTAEQVEEYAFASAVKGKAPNEHIGWLQGRYVEANRPNLNGAMWLSDELAVKALTPMLMPVTVMHDPSTAVGVIADTKFIEEEGSQARIDNVLGIWRHRFPQIWDEVAHNVASGTMMESMECFAPHYSCGDCGETFVKLARGAEQASWCSHLKGDNPRRILGDVCFTGTGLIFGTRGGVGAYTDAHLDHFHDEVAEYHERAHTDTSPSPKRSATQMAKVEIEESELATLRTERKDALAEVETLKDAKRSLESKVETAEAQKVQAEQAKAEADRKVQESEEKAQRASLKDSRISALGAGFVGALGETSKARLAELASTCTDEQWNVELAEREEMAKVKRDAPATSTTTSTTTSTEVAGSGFSSEEVASFLGRAMPSPAAAASVNADSAVKSLARTFDKKRRPASATA